MSEALRKEIAELIKELRAIGAKRGSWFARLRRAYQLQKRLEALYKPKKEPKNG